MPEIVRIILIILTSGLPCALLALGIFLTFRLLDFADLTAEGSFLIGGVTTVTMIVNGANPIVATLMSLLAGAACGFITGILNTKLKIPKLLSGIITMTASASITMIIMGTSVKGRSFVNLITLGSNDKTIYSLITVPNQMRMVLETGIMAVVVILVIIALYFFFGTEYGMAIRATGMNAKMARANGINTNIATIICVSLSNAIIGLAGSLFAQDMRSMDVGGAAGFLVIGLASILIGEAIFGKRNFKNWLISVALGAIVYFIIVQLALYLGFPTELKNLLYAILITIALCIPLMKMGFKNLKNKIHDRFARKEVTAQ
ncbi:MAG: ABC transporter permease [Bacilli bacterium]|nr:ABC transporter permease [Bacilli bacterium]